MASQWYSLVSQKLFLASTLLDVAAQAAATGSSAPTQKLQQEAATQGSIELLLRAKQLLLAMIARLYQKRPNRPLSLAELANLIGDEATEIEFLTTLERDSRSWWSHLDQLETAQNNPPATRKTVNSENIIAVSAETGPDRSAQALRKTLKAIKQFTDNLEAQHGEW
ncbi:MULTISPECIES: DUF6586 family protein [Marinobacter]|uniref:Uncharacterized protein n=1 Tax=Marinobacter xiaoshiensis TaxID=3073652 RepID=A0ABU2HEQ1_9GAMM|nr:MULTISPECIES: DUF6586 family protein [unclassified Marinobacter]MBK1872117.1 hypothetical protein [Marinobacter sp. 1-3A]MDS1309549.1 hypothetical protein [Marinobacter sp. F60267]